jgi:ribonuclease-3
LEFLGDRVLELCVAEWLYQRDPDADEGTLSKDLAWRVDEVNLARAGERLQVKRALRLSTCIDRQEVSDKIVADVVEALVGAIYLDVGLDAARHFIEAFIPLQGEPPAEFHSTNELFERCISLGLSPPQFIEVAEGPDNKAVWRVECVVGERRTLGRAKRKRDARKEACQAMLLLLSGD